jgi:tRNA(fMet)-specific endonuclease VapC
VTRHYLLDTNVISYIIKGRSPQARARLAALSVEEIAGISAITEGELLYGLAKAGSSQDRQRAIAWFVWRLKVHPWGSEAAAAYGVLRAKQEALGKTLGPLDMQIAAHALSLGATLVTSDQAFRNVDGLAGVENWATDV